MSALPDIRPGLIPARPFRGRRRGAGLADSLEAVRNGSATCRAICLDGDAFDRDLGVNAGELTAIDRVSRDYQDELLLQPGPLDGSI